MGPHQAILWKIHISEINDSPAEPAQSFLREKWDDICLTRWQLIRLMHLKEEGLGSV